MSSKIVISLILGCGILGGYASIFTSYIYGYFDALRICVSSLSREECILDMSDSVSWKFSGIDRIDNLINILLEFFSQGLRSHPGIDGVDVEALLAFVYLAAQFGGAWYIIAQEGLRRRNNDTILSWTGTFGIAFQSITITIVAPVYFTIQLLKSSPNMNLEALLVDPWDLELLPLSAILTYIVPTTGLCLPLLKITSTETKMCLVALWQPFPLYHTIVRTVSRAFHGKHRYDDPNSGLAEVKHCRVALRRSNRVIAGLLVTLHLAVMSAILVSDVNESTPGVSGHHVLVLTSLTHPPTEAMLEPPMSLISSREIVVSFLRWDVYCTAAALLIWSTHQRCAMRMPTNFIAFGIKIIVYTLLGGPTFPALILLWERDEIVLNSLESLHQDKISVKRSRLRDRASNDRNGRELNQVQM